MRSVLHGLLALAFLVQHPEVARAGMTCSYSLVITDFDWCPLVSGCSPDSYDFAVAYNEVCSAGSINACPANRCGVWLLYKWDSGTSAWVLCNYKCECHTAAPNCDTTHSYTDNWNATNATCGNTNSVWAAPHFLVHVKWE
jgi:hypothetical protein